MDYRSACPNHEGYSYNKSSGDCSCGSNHYRWASKWNPGGQQRPAAHDASLGVGHIWTNVQCPAYRTLNGGDCTCA